MLAPRRSKSAGIWCKKKPRWLQMSLLSGRGISSSSSCSPRAMLTRSRRKSMLSAAGSNRWANSRYTAGWPWSLVSARAISRLRRSPTAIMGNASRSLAELPPESKGVMRWIELCVYSVNTRLVLRSADPPLKKRMRGPSSGARS